MSGMALLDALLPEFDREMGLTRRVLDRVPDSQWAWKPHPTSMTLGRLAEHLAEMPQWAVMTMTQGQPRDDLGPTRGLRVARDPR